MDWPIGWDEMAVKHPQLYIRLRKIKIYNGYAQTAGAKPIEWLLDRPVWEQRHLIRRNMRPYDPIDPGWDNIVRLVEDFR